MLAELVENGLSYSSPDVEVEIYGRKTGGRYLLAVVDYGIGMPKEELEKAKARLRDEENFLVAPTRFLGHYVVGRLARQMSVQVDLGESPVSGITARMLLPAELMAERPDAQQKDTGAGGRRHGSTRTVSQASAERPAGPSTGPQPVVPEPAPVASATGSPNETTTKFTAPLIEPPARRTQPPMPVASDTSRPVRVSPSDDPPTVVHRWPTEQESVSLPDEPPHPVTVAALAKSAPYDPARATAAQYRPASNGSVSNGSVSNGSVSNGSVPNNGAANSSLANSVTSLSAEERTRNGLVKRQPRHRGAATSRPPTTPAPPRHTVGEPAVDRSPTEVGSMLSAFRRGHLRGELNSRSNGDASSHVEREEEPGDH
jgi:hypothetical protein